MQTIGILGDLPTASTGFATVLRNLGNELTRYFKVIYFGRFGCEKEFEKEPKIIGNNHFLYVPVQGGVWDRELIIRLLSYYSDVESVICIDDWFSAYGLVGACNFLKKPLHFITPIDSLPIHEKAYDDIFQYCDKIYVPNSSYQLFNGRKRTIFSEEHIKKRVGLNLKSIYLPHGADTTIFYPKKVERSPKFTFFWSGRCERRKNPSAFILAAEKISKVVDVEFYMRTDWRTPIAQRIQTYIVKKNLPFYLDQMTDCPHEYLNEVNNKGDVNICTSRAGGCEMGILETSACGLPSICTDWTFMNENVINMKTGLLVSLESFSHPPLPEPKEIRTSDIAIDRIWGDISIDDLAEKMMWCYLNQDMVKNMGKMARLNIIKNFNWNTEAKKLAGEIKI